MKIKTVELKIKGMTCDHCAHSVAKVIDGKGVVEKEVSYKNANALVSFDGDLLSAEEISNMVNNTGHYKVTGFDELENNDNSDLHLVIIGGGSAAFAATIEAQSQGARVTMINAGLPIGGTCVNVGCVPSKNLIRAAETIHKANNILFPGISGEAKLDSLQDLIRQKDELVLGLRQEKYINVVKDMEKVRIVEGRASFTGTHTVSVNDETIRGDYFLIATGARTFVPEIPGLADVPYLTNETAFNLEILPKSMIILGGRYIALEIAQMFSRLGTKVTVLQRSDHIIPDEANDISEALAQYLSAEGIDIVTGNELRKIAQNGTNFTVTSKVAGNERIFEAEQLVVATGRQANTENMGLGEAGVTFNSRGFIDTDGMMMTSQSNIFAAGDVTGKHMFVYTAAYEGKLAANNALSKLQRESDYAALPWVVFTDPQIAGVGMDEKKAEEAGIDYEVATLEMKHVPRAIAARDTRGLIKLIRNRENDQLIGARILAPEGSELLMEAAMAIKFGITVTQMKEMFHPYLTLSEGIKLAAITFNKNVTELSCCAT